MGYGSYSSYKDSEVLWLDRIPSHWQMMKISHIAILKSGENITSLQISPNDSYPVYGGNGIRGYFSQYTHERKHVLIGRQGALCGNINYSEGKFWASEHAIVVRPDIELSTEWLGETLRSMNLGQYSVSAAQPGLSVEMITKLKLPFPPLPEQTQIARFLDYKTAQLDQLIAKKQALIERLNEQRIALITQAVTRGLNPDAALKDSGVEWLGQVPKGWEVKRLRFISAGIEQGWSPQCDANPAEDDQWGVLKVGCVNGNELDPLENKALPGSLDAREEYEIQPGDILISRANTKELLGSAAIVPATIRKQLLLCDKLYRLKPAEEIDPEFLVFVLRTPIARYQYEREATGASGSMQNIGQDTIKNLTIPVPPITEQHAIVEQLKSDLVKKDKMLSLTEDTITRLEEYRTALITAAVTGKIDVREFEVPEQAPDA